MASSDTLQLLRAWRGGGEPAAAVPALLATLRRAVGAGAASAWRAQDADPEAPRWRDPPGPAGTIAGEFLEMPLAVDGEIVGRLRVDAAPGAGPWDDDARELVAIAADLLARDLARDA